MPPPPADRPLATGAPTAQDARCVVLVEGVSDRAALLACAARRGRDLGAEQVWVVPLGGITNIGAAVRRYGPAGAGHRLAGLYDAAEERFVRGALAQAGADPRDLAGHGFFRCEADLEDELLRALGAGGAEAVLERNGDLPAFRTLQQQPAQRHRPVEAQLHRFLGAGSGRKERYAALLVDAVPSARMPAPLDAVLAYVAQG